MVYHLMPQICAFQGPQGKEFFLFLLRKGRGLIVLFSIVFGRRG